MVSKYTQKTLSALRDLGRTSEIVERFIQSAGSFGHRRDLFKFIDIIALDPVDGLIGVQSFGADFSGHMRKIMETEDIRRTAIRWLITPGSPRIELWGWRKLKSNRNRWTPRVARLTLEDFPTEEVERERLAWLLSLPIDRPRPWE